MEANLRKRGTVLAITAIFALSACSESQADNAAPANNATTTISVTDNDGNKTIELPLGPIVATDNRTFETLADWDIPLAAGAVSLMPEGIAYKNDSGVIDLGSHREPNLEALVAVEPALVINGQRYAQFKPDIQKLVPDSVVLDLDPREEQPFDAELKRQVTVLGEIFGKQTQASELIADFDASIARVKAAYEPGTKVLGVIVSGGEIGYVAPGVGRTLGPLFDIFGFEPALEVDGSTDHEGDDVSVEAIAASNPDLILVMDRDGAIAQKEPDYKPAVDVIAGSQALKEVSAVKSGNVVYAPTDTYTNEGIQTYTEFFNDIADQLETN